MTTRPTEAVIAGSKSFALALLAPLTERVGTRPRIAADPSQALALTGGRGLVVVEFQGDGSLDAIRQLLDQAAGLEVIAAVPEGNATAEAALRALGVEPARWDGRADDVLSAVARRLGTAAGAPGAADTAQPAAVQAAPAPAPAAPVVAAPPAAAAARPAVGGLFDDLPLDDAEEPASASVAAPHAVAPPPPASAGPWPADVPGNEAAEKALADGIRGVFAPPGTPFSVVAETMAAMSSLEREVLLGEAKPFDVEPIRRAAVMRVRVAVALATAPRAAGTPTDPAAVSALLAEIDALLAAVAALAADAPPALQAPLEQVRNALVKEAIDFSEAAHPAEPDAAASAAAAQPAAGVAHRASRTRVLHIATEAERAVEVAEGKRLRRSVGALVIAALVAGGYHGYGYWVRHNTRVERPTRLGAPDGAAVTVTHDAAAPIVVRSADGRPFSPEEIRRMSDIETMKGNVVTETAPGVVVITRARGAAAPAPHPNPAPTATPEPAPGRAP